MNQLERQLLQRVYTYDNGDYVLVADLMTPNATANLSYENGHVKAIVRTESDILGDISIPIRHRLEDEPEISYNNGIITVEGKLVEDQDETSVSNNE